MNTHNKGQIACLKFELRALEKGLIVLKPTIEGSRFDYVIYDGTKFQRVQIKYSDSKNKVSSGSTSINLKRANNGTKNVRMYSADEIDVVIAYIAPVDKLVCLPPNIFAERPSVLIRYELAKNGQRKNCLFVEEYEW